MITFGRLGGCGRLGNQLWQVASTVGIARKMGEQPYFDPEWAYRPYFSLPDEWFELEPGSVLHQAHGTSYVNYMDPRAREYLQDYNLWKDVSDEIRDAFMPSVQAMERLYEDQWLLDFLDDNGPSLSVHVRRGDNAAAPNNCHPLRPFSFYEESIESLRGQFGSIVVFSDDPEWCRREFSGYEVEYPISFFVGTPRKKEHEAGYRTEPVLDWIDLFFMTFCDRHIIGNSSYAFWGAFLSHDKSPIYPMPFFGSDLDYIDVRLMFPESWIPHDHGQQHV